MCAWNGQTFQHIKFHQNIKLNQHIKLPDGSKLGKWFYVLTLSFRFQFFSLNSYLKYIFRSFTYIICKLTYIQYIIHNLIYYIFYMIIYNWIYFMIIYNLSYYIFYMINRYRSLKKFKLSKINITLISAGRSQHWYKLPRE